jgi:hypothetical protein
VSATQEADEVVAHMLTRHPPGGRIDEVALAQRVIKRARFLAPLEPQLAEELERRAAKLDPWGARRGFR